MTVCKVGSPSPPARLLCVSPHLAGKRPGPWSASAVFPSLCHAGSLENAGNPCRVVEHRACIHARTAEGFPRARQGETLRRSSSSCVAISPSRGGRVELQRLLPAQVRSGLCNGLGSPGRSPPRTGTAAQFASASSRHAGVAACFPPGDLAAQGDPEKQPLGATVTGRSRCFCFTARPCGASGGKAASDPLGHLHLPPRREADAALLHTPNTSWVV